MSWNSPYRGDGVARELELPPAPPWRTFPRQPMNATFQPPEGLVEAVNAALCLRRPLLVTGAPGTGKSTIVESVAAELQLGVPLRWHITSRSTLTDALYRYDVLGRIHARQLGRDTDEIEPFLRLGPLGTALMPSDKPRALLVDEIDKSDLDLPSDLLDVLERGEFEIPELSRYERDEVGVKGWTGEETHQITHGRVQCREFPFIVMTNNGEREFPAPFLRRCVRYTMPSFTDSEIVRRVVAAHLGQVTVANPEVASLIDDFVSRIRSGEVLAVDQLLGAAHLLAGRQAPAAADRQRLLDNVLRELTRA